MLDNQIIFCVYCEKRDIKWWISWIIKNSLTLWVTKIKRMSRKGKKLWI